MYTVDDLSIGEITRRLNAQGVATRKQSSRWERRWSGRCYAIQPIAAPLRLVKRASPAEFE